MGDLDEHSRGGGEPIGLLHRRLLAALAIVFIGALAVSVEYVEASARDSEPPAEAPVALQRDALPPVSLAPKHLLTDVDTRGDVLASFSPVSIEDLPLVGGAAGGLVVPGPVAPPGLESEGSGELDVTLVSVWKGELAAGETLSNQLSAEGVPGSIIKLIEDQVRSLFDFRHSRPGHRYRLALDPHGNLVEFRYSTSKMESIYLHWDGAGYVAFADEAELEARVTTLGGSVEGSLYESLRAQGEDPRLAESFASIFAWDIDFTRNVKSGDEFRMVYERLYMYDDDGEEIYVRPGRILAASYRGRVGEHAAVYFEQEQGRGSYYRVDGSAVKREFLVAPLRYSRISSTFTNARRHPILKVTRRHPGVDYAAAEGTELWSVADGTVIYRGWAGGSGKLVKVQHANGYVSHYAHLSRFAKGLNVGDRVGQKEVIGYVGHTGLATGPHVCFRVTRNGRYVNPLKIMSPAGVPIEPENAPDFARVRDDLLPELGIVTLAATDEAL